MAKYRTSETVVEAERYTGQPVEELPAWLRDKVKGVSGMGEHARLLVEMEDDGHAEHLPQGEWAVLFGEGDLEFIPDTVFQRQFKAVEEAAEGLAPEARGE